MQINDILSGFYLFGFLLGLVLCAALIAGSSDRRFPNRILALLIAVISLFVLRKIPYTSGLILQYPHFMGSYSLAFGLGPLLFLYARTLVRGETRFKRSSFIHFLPMLLIFVSLIPLISLTTADKHKIASAYYSGEFAEEIRAFGYWGYTVVSLSWLHFSCYCFGVIQLLRRHEIHVLDQFSYLNKVSLQWLHLLTRGCLLVALAGLAIHCLIFLLGEPLASPMTRYTEMLLVLLIYMVGYMGLRQPAIFQPTTEESTSSELALSRESQSPESKPPESKSPDSKSPGPQSSGSQPPNPLPPIEPRAMGADNEAMVKYGKSSLTEGAAEAYKTQLLELMASEKPFLDSELTLAKLSERTGIPHHHLSQVINAKLGRNFYDFINHYRVTAAQEILTDPQRAGEAVTDIAMAVGFNNKNSFYKAFKSQVEITPAAYRRQALKTHTEA